MADTTPSIDHTILSDLAEAGLVKSDRYLPALEIFRRSDFWNSWALKALFALAIGHILAGIIFFFAHNWFEFPDLMKFGVVGGGIAVCVLGWLALKLDGPIAQALGVAATVLVGVMFAVFGQVYQTPALIHTPFVMWAFMTLPFAAMSKNLAHWAVWLAIAVVAVFAYASTGLRITGNEFGADAFILGAGFVSFLALVIYDKFLNQKYQWTGAEWFRVYVIAIIGAFLVVTFTSTFWGRNFESLLSLVAVILSISLLAYLYRFKPSLPTLALSTFVLFIISAQILFRIVDDIGDVGSLLFIFLGLVGLIIGMAKAFSHFAKISPKRHQTPVNDKASKPISAVSARQVASALGLDESDVQDVINRSDGEPSPWYIETFLAIGGVFAAIFGCGFVGSFLGLILTQFDDFGPPLLVIGLIVFSGATALRMKTGNGFTRHFFNTLILVGSITAIFGVGVIMEDIEPPIFLAILLAILTLFMVRDRIIEFLSALTISGCVGFELYYRLEGAMPETLFLVLATGLGVFFLTRPVGKRLFWSAGTAFLVAPALLGILLVHFERFERLIGEDVLDPISWAPRLASLLVLGAAVVWVNISNKERKAWRPPLFILIPLVLAMALLPFGGASALLLILLGYILGSRSLAIVGVLLQIYFLYMFYYDLGLSLGLKSYLLMITGVIFLGVWYVSDHLRRQAVSS